MPKIGSESMKWQYFSVKYAIRLDGKKHVPCVCYPINSAYRSTVLDLAKKGTATLYESKVRFLSGKVVDGSVTVEATTPTIVPAATHVPVVQFSSDSPSSEE